jgi:hypothetical protein
MREEIDMLIYNTSDGNEYKVTFYSLQMVANG